MFVLYLFLTQMSSDNVRCDIELTLCLLIFVKCVRAVPKPCLFMIVIILLQREGLVLHVLLLFIYIIMDNYFSVLQREPGSSCPFAVHFYIINEVFNRQLSFSVLQIEPPSLLHQPSSATSTAFDVIKNFFGEKPM